MSGGKTLGRKSPIGLLKGREARLEMRIDGNILGIFLMIENKYFMGLEPAPGVPGRAHNGKDTDGK